MDGRPVWLASVSYQPDGEIVPTGRWSEGVQLRADRILDELLEGVGDTSREVVFRMNVTRCKHRGLSDTEEADLPSSFHEFEATDTAGCAVELISSKGVTGIAHLPCENMGRMPHPTSPNPELWLPEPCGDCGPCRARDSRR